MQTDYLGDGAYVKYEPTADSIVVYTHDGLRMTNEVWLGARELDALITFIKAVTGKETL